MRFIRKTFFYCCRNFSKLKFNVFLRSLMEQLFMGLLFIYMKSNSFEHVEYGNTNLI
ncbi:hypothetical protein YC2023_061245 [Brassica napus]